jgi:aryl-alcohol dehydrogenase-like predicted oxidoreductase
MDYYLLGKSGLRVSRLALGAMTFGDSWGWGTAPETARSLFDAYVDAGGNFIDTADAYSSGSSEEMVGAYIAERSLRDRMVIATKFSFNNDPGNPNAGGNGRKAMIRAVEASLKRLKTDYIDLYLMHVWDGMTPVEEVMRTFDDLVRSGKVRHVGLSDAPAWYVSRAQALAEFRGFEPVTAYQLEYSLIERNLEREFVQLGAYTGAGIMVWSPLAGGLLSGKYRPSEQGRAQEGRLAIMNGGGNPGSSRFSERNFAIVAALETAADAIGKPMAQVAVNWVANRPGVASVILGATKVAQLQDNLAALDFTIPAEILTQLDEASALPVQFPYNFQGPEMEAMLSGGAAITAKPEGYVK